MLTIAQKVNTEVKKIEAKIHKIHERIEAREQRSKDKFPGQTVLEIETIEDSITIAGLMGEIKGLQKIKKAFPNSSRA